MRPSADNSLLSYIPLILQMRKKCSFMLLYLWYFTLLKEFCSCLEAGLDMHKSIILHIISLLSDIIY